jgi:hypothetical protein
MTYYFGMKITRMGRPPKAPKDRRNNGLRIPLTDDERAIVEGAAESDGTKPITWARDAVLRAARRKIGPAGN